MRSIICHIIFVIVTDLSVYGQRNSDQRAPNKNEQPLYEYYYNDDEYYYADDLSNNANTQQAPLATASTNIKPQKVAAVTEETDSLSEAKEAIAQYDIDELVIAWREYMEEKEQKEKEEEKTSSISQTAPSGFRRPQNRFRPGQTGRRRPGQTGRRPGVNADLLSNDYEEPINTAPRRRRPRPNQQPTGLRTGPRRRRPNRPRPIRLRTTTTTTTTRRPALLADDFYYDYGYEDDYASKFEDLYESRYECPPLDQTYSTPDPVQCDKYYECNIKGEEKEKLCIDGYMYDINAQHCDYPSKVNCTGRPKLQDPQPSKNCPRANGFFPFPANESCQKFWDCREGKSYLQKCAEGVIFDPKIDACTTPDQSARPECQAAEFLGFVCPKYDSEEILRFGNHDRLSSPKDCTQFFSCLRTGQPRLGACPKKTVFNEATGHCDDPNNVKGCENYWKDKEKEDFKDYYDY